MTRQPKYSFNARRGFVTAIEVRNVIICVCVCVCVCVRACVRVYVPRKSLT